VIALELLVRRFVGSKVTTLGGLYVDQVFCCYTLEDVERIGLLKVAGKTAIPRGRYRVELTHSPKFGRVMPLIWNVGTSDGRKLVVGDGKQFEGVRIHSGNDADDTEGCLLVGDRLAPGPDRILDSRVAFDRLFTKLEAASKRGEIWLTIEASL